MDNSKIKINYIKSEKKNKKSVLETKVFQNIFLDELLRIQKTGNKQC